MGAAGVVAMGFAYPGPGHLDRLVAAAATLESGSVRRPMDRFIGAVGELELGEWEELHTVTCDLSPHFVPYVGHVTWGENYRRGEFMADLKADMEIHGVELNGELPDHIEVILRYIDVVPEPRKDLMDALPDAVASMSHTLSKASADNPYRQLLAATAAAVGEPSPVKIGARR
jgi:nitrate reductase delta subunit